MVLLLISLYLTRERHCLRALFWRVSREHWWFVFFSSHPRHGRLLRGISSVSYGLSARCEYHWHDSGNFIQSWQWSRWDLLLWWGRWWLVYPLFEGGRKLRNKIGGFCKGSTVSRFDNFFAKEPKFSILAKLGHLLSKGGSGSVGPPSPALRATFSITLRWQKSLTKMAYRWIILYKAQIWKRDAIPCFLDPEWPSESDFRWAEWATKFPRWYALIRLLWIWQDTSWLPYGSDLSQSCHTVYPRG